MSRIKELLLKCAADLEDGRIPLSTEFLCDNKVTMDECYALSEQMATAVKAYAKAPPGLTMRMIVCAEMPQEQFKSLDDILDEHLRHEKVRERLRELSS